MAAQTDSSCSSLALAYSHALRPGTGARRHGAARPPRRCRVPAADARARSRPSACGAVRIRAPARRRAVPATAATRRRAASTAPGFVRYVYQPLRARAFRTAPMPTSTSGGGRARLAPAGRPGLLRRRRPRRHVRRRRPLHPRPAHRHARAGDEPERPVVPGQLRRRPPALPEPRRRRPARSAPLRRSASRASASSRAPRVR